MKIIKTIGTFVVWALFGAIAYIVYVDYEQDKRIASLEADLSALETALAAHREDARTAVGKIYEDIGTIRFTQAALANTLRFVAPKEAK